MSPVRISLSLCYKENKTKYIHYLALRFVLYPAEIARQVGGGGERNSPPPETRNLGFSVSAVSVVFCNT